MGNIVKFYPKNAADNPDNVLERAVGVYESVLIIGYDSDGELDVRASNDLTASEVLWMIESFKKKLLDGDYRDDSEE